MLIQRNLILSVALALLTVPASADPFIYVVTQNQQSGTQQFGAVDLASGAFQQIGPSTTEFESGLVPGPNGSLLTLGPSGNLNSINPTTGVITTIGPTGLGDAQTALGELGGKLYATDLNNNLYAVNSTTGAAQRIGPTGIPALPFIPTSINPDGTINIFNETLFGAGGKLYATFDADTFDPSVPMITPVIASNLYQIDPATGATTVVAPTTLLMTASLDLNGSVYALIGNAEALTHVVTLDLANGHTSFVSNVDPTAGLIFGAAPVPEPTSVALTVIGIAGIALCIRRKRTCA
jgi:hypothetical protein